MKAPKKGAGGLVRVQFFRGREVIRTHEVVGETITLGSSPECTIRAGGHASVAARHVTIYVEEKTLTLVPEPGTAIELNGKAVDVAFPRPSDLITAGRLTFSVELLDSKTAEEKAAENSGADGSSASDTRKKSSWLGSFFKKKDKNEEGQGDEGENFGQDGDADGKADTDTSDKNDDLDEKPTRVMSWEEGLPNWTASIDDDHSEALSDKDFNDDCDTVQKESELQELAGRIKKKIEKENSGGSPGKDYPPDLEDTEPPTAVAKQSYPLAVEPTKVGPNPSDFRNFRNNQPTKVGPNPSELPGNSQSTRVGPSPSESPTNRPTRVEPNPLETVKPTPLESEEKETSSAIRRAGEAPDTEPVALRQLRGDPPTEEYYFSDDEYDEEHFAEAFNLSEALSVKPVPRKGLREPYLGANVVRFFGGQVAEVFGVLPGKPYCSHTRELKCRVSKTKVKLRVHPRVRGKLRAQGRAIVLGIGQKNFRNIVLLDGDSAALTGAEGVYNINVFPPPAFPWENLVGRRQLIVSMAAVFFAVLALHVAAALGVFHYYPPVIIETDRKEPAEIFAEVTVGDWEKPIFPAKLVTGGERIDPNDVISLSEKTPVISAKTFRELGCKVDAGLIDIDSEGVRGDEQEAAGTSGRDDEGTDSDEPPEKTAEEDKDKAKGDEPALGAAGKDGKSEPVRLGKVTWSASKARIRGGLDKKQVLEVVDADSEAIQQCYENALAKWPGLSGRAVLVWIVKGDGRVGAVSLRSSTLRQARVVSCLSKRIRSWRFPSPKKGTATIVFTFQFDIISS